VPLHLFYISKGIMKNIGIYILLLMLTSLAMAEVLYQNTPFYQGMNSYHTFRIPAMVQTTNGTLLAFCEGRKNSGSDTGNIDLVLRRSFDSGNTWQSLQVVWSDGTNTCGNPVPVVDSSNGRIWLFMTHNNGSDTLEEINDGTSIEVRTIWSCYSDDNGTTWSTPVNRFNEVQDADTRWDSTGPGNGIQLSYGTKAGRLIIPAIGRIIYSDNHGTTWTQGGGSTGGSESSVAELNYGTLMRNDRATSSYRSYLRRLVYYSYNYGASWSSPIIRDDLVDPICQGSMISYVPTGLSDRLILFSNPAATTRIKMTVKMSQSNGGTFETQKLIYGDSSAYSCLAKMSGDNIGLLYENGDGSPYHRIGFARFTTGWLKDRSIFLWDFEDYTAGSTIPASAGAVEDVRGYGFNGTPTAPMTTVAGSDEYSNGTAAHFDGSGQGIKITDSDSHDVLDFNSEEDFIIRVVFRTSAHTTGGSTGAGSLVAKDVGSNSQSWWLRVQDGKVRFLVDNSTQTTSVVSGQYVSDNKWHEVLAVNKGSSSTLELYLDGSLAGQATTAGGSYANDNDVSIGVFNSGACSFIGDIDLVQMYRANRQQVLTVKDGDLNYDSIVDFCDLAVLMQNWLSF
jgi:hypothetical protein